MEITEPRAMRALADATRLRLVHHLTRSGPQSLAALAEHTGLSPNVGRAHLRALAEVGVTRRCPDGRWETVGTGIVVQVPDDDPEAQAAARKLSGVMLLDCERLPRQWVEHVEPRLEVEWARAAGMFNAGISMTAQELESVQEELERLFASYIKRDRPPESARTVRFLCYFLPSADSGHDGRHT